MTTTKKNWLNSDKAFAKRLGDALSGFFMPSIKWLKYILCDDQVPYDLQKQMSILWIYAMMDSLRQTAEEIDEYEEYAEAAGNQDWKIACNEIRQNIKAITGLLNKFTKEEQVLIIFERNYLIHGFLTRYNDTPPMYWFENGEQVQASDKSWKNFKEMIEPLLGVNHASTTHGFLKKIQESEFPRLMDFIGSAAYLQNFERTIYKDLMFEENDPIFITRR